MKLQKFEIENFRSFKKLELDNLPGLLILFGRNGSGKSNVLASLEQIFAPKIDPGYQSDAPETEAPFYRGLIHDFGHNFYRNVAREVPFSLTILTSEPELNGLWPQGRTLVSEALKSAPTPTSSSKGTAKKAAEVKRLRLTIDGLFEPVAVSDGAVEIKLKQVKLNEIVVYEAGAKESPWLPALSATSTIDERESLGEGLLNRLTGLFSTIGVARALRREPFEDPNEDATAARRRLENDPSDSFKRRLFAIKHSQRQQQQARYREIQRLFGEIGKWGQFDFAKSGSGLDELDIMTWDESSLWLPLVRRGAGAEQLLVIMAEVLVRGARIIGIEELESNLDDLNKAALYEFLESLSSSDGSPLGQVIATAHTSYYGKKLEEHQKRFVMMTDDGSNILPWSGDRYADLFGTRA